MADFNIFGTVARVVINGTEWQPQHTQEALAAIGRYRRFLTAALTERSPCMQRSDAIRRDRSMP